MAKMFLVCGISGVGKTTISQRISKEDNLHRLGIDDFYTKVNGDERNRQNKFEVWIEFFKAIHELEESNRDCIIEISGLTRHQRREFVEWFPSFDHHLIFIEADADLRNKNNVSRLRQVPKWRIADMESKVQRPNILSEDNAFKTIAFIQNTNNYFSAPKMIKGDWQLGDDYNE